MAISHIHNRSITIEMRKKLKDGNEFVEEIEGFEVFQPSIETYHFNEMFAHDDEWTIMPADTAFPAMTITLTGNVSLYEKVRKLVTDCNEPLGPLRPPPLDPPARSMLLPALAVLAALLAIMLLAGGLG